MPDIRDVGFDWTDGLTGAATNRDLQERARDEQVNIMEFITASADRAAIRAGTNTDDLTSVYNTATAQIDAAGGGTLYMPAGTYHGKMQFVRSGVTKVLGIKGEIGGTIMRAATDNDFAIVLDGTTYADYPWVMPFIEGIGFDGKDSSGTARYKCGIYAGRLVHVNDCAFYDCLIGLFYSDQYYGNSRNLYIADCDIGVYTGTYGTGFTTIADLINGDDTADSVTVPAAPNASGHAGNRMFDHLRIRNCRVGFFIGGKSDTPNMLLRKSTIELCDLGVGLYSDAGCSLTMESCWNEANGNSFGDTGTITVNGKDLEEQGIYMGGSARQQLNLRNCDWVDGLKAADGQAVIDIDDVYWAGSKPWSISREADIKAKRLRTPGRSIGQPTIVEQPWAVADNTLPMWCFVPTTRTKSYIDPPRGSVLIAESFEGASLDTSRLTFDNTPTFEATGGIWDSQKCASVAFGANEGFSLDIDGVMTGTLWWMLRMTIKGSVNFYQVSIPNVAAFHRTSSLLNGNLYVEDTWQTICVMGKTTGSISTAPRVQFSGAMTVEFSALELLSSADPGHIETLARDSHFYVNET